MASNQTYPNKGTTDFHTQLNAAIAAGADDLIGGGHFQDGQAIVSQLSSVNWKPKVVSLLVAVTEPSFQSGLGAAANNVTGPSQWESAVNYTPRSEEHTSELQSRGHLVCRLLLGKKKNSAR